MEAADESKRRGGQTVQLHEVMRKATAEAEGRLKVLGAVPGRDKSR
jgi:hypothetical protein